MTITMPIIIGAGLFVVVCGLIISHKIGFALGIYKGREEIIRSIIDGKIKITVGEQSTKDECSCNIKTTNEKTN